MNPKPSKQLGNRSIVAQVVDFMLLRGPISRLARLLEHAVFKIDVYEVWGDEVVRWRRRTPRFKLQEVSAWRQIFIGFGVPLVVVKLADGRTLELSDKYE